MEYIESITINNARRLGENFKIEFGKGVTIIVAPNGTGKTTIFEAMELALTGGIKRLEKSPDAIIKNGIDRMSVRLDFLEGKFCEAQYSKGGKLSIEGDYDELFENEIRSSLPYLFRLTHFLEQSGKEWFVEQNDKDAGNLLSQLPIGKDLQKIISKKTSLIRGIRQSQTNAEEKLNKDREKLQEFENLKRKRDEINKVTDLIPLEKIVSEINNFCRSIGEEQFKGSYQLLQITNHFEKLKVIVNNKYDINQGLCVKLNALKDRVDEFNININIINQKEEHIRKSHERIDDMISLLGKNKKEFEEQKEILYKLESEIETLKKIQTAFINKEIKDENLKNKIKELTLNEEQLSKKENSYEILSKKLTDNESYKDKYTSLDEQLKNEKENLIEFENKKESQKKWNAIVAINDEISNIKIPKIKKGIDESKELQHQIYIEYVEAEKSYNTKKKTLESLNNASSAIQEAVSTIRKNLSVNQRKCPVCQAEYEPNELIEKIEVSLKTLNPVIPQAIEDEKEALKSFNRIKEKQDSENKKLNDKLAELEKENKNLEDNKKIILELFMPLFSEFDTPEKAAVSLDENIEKTRDKISMLISERKQYKSEIIKSEIIKVQLEKSQCERDLNELQRKSKNIKNQINNLNSDIKSINEILVNYDKEKIDEAIKLNTNRQLETKEKAKNFKLVINNLNDNLNEYKKVLLDDNETVSKMKSIQEGIKTEWGQAELDNKPNKEILIAKSDQVLKQIAILEKIKNNFNTIDQMLINWKLNERFTELNDEIKNKIGIDMDEKEYVDLLKNKVSISLKKLEDVIEKGKAIESLFTNLMLKSTEIHEQLNSINEPWKKLLSRVVISPLITSSPLLSNTTSRNKPIAKTSAIINEESINIANIASEAQITDLQLTLMLSLACKYKWTQWKGLLLDDPTQYHDLVNSASLFDLLRDYIIEFDYQIMMSTHDIMQAKFFKRKLENEGVPVKLYKLVPTKDGVVAERTF